MGKPFKGVVNIDITTSTPDWTPYAQPVAPDDSPNILDIVLDDVGFSAMEPFGGLIETPNINRIANSGLVYNNFHTTAMCSPTRSCLLTGRNHTTNSMASITEAAAGFPNSSGHIPFECGNVAEVLGERGWNAYMVGKWHLCPEDEMNLASVRRIPTGHSVFSASYERDGDTMPAVGTLTLHVGTTTVGEARIKTQPGKFSIAGEGLNIGKDGGEPVTDDYPGTSPWAFTGGTIERVMIDVSGEPFVDLAEEAKMAFARD